MVSWSREMDCRLKDLCYLEMSTAEIAAEMNLPSYMVNLRRGELGVRWYEVRAKLHEMSPLDPLVRQMFASLTAAIGSVKCVYRGNDDFELVYERMVYEHLMDDVLKLQADAIENLEMFRMMADKKEALCGAGKGD